MLNNQMGTETTFLVKTGQLVQNLTIWIFLFEIKNDTFG